MATTTSPRAGGWQLEGSAAAAYEAYLVPAIFDGMSRGLVATAELQPGERVLDLACGTGVVARAAAARVSPSGTVTGVDVNPDMLATARRAAADVAPGIEWDEADAADLPFDDDCFDVALCQEALQFFTDRRAVLAELRRVVVAGGRIACSVLRSLDHNPVYARFASALGEYAGPRAEHMMASPFALGDAATLRGDARAVGLTDVEIRIAIGEERFPSVAEFVRREAASSPLAGPLSELDQSRLTALVQSLERDLADHVDDAGLVFHNETHLVTART